MKSDTFLNQVHDTNTRRELLLQKRGQEYAKDSDQLSSFKEMSAIWNTLHPSQLLSPTDIAEILVILKLMRFANLRSSAFSSLDDTMQDLHNYLDLTYALINEAKSSAQKDPKFDKTKASKSEVLDIGFVGGEIAKGATIGIDPYASEGALEPYSQAKGFQSIVGRVEQLPFKDSSIPKIVSRSSFCYWTDPVQGLKEIIRVLKPGGKAAISGVTADLEEIKEYRCILKDAGAKNIQFLFEDSITDDSDEGQPRGRTVDSYLLKFSK